MNIDTPAMKPIISKAISPMATDTPIINLRLTTKTIEIYVMF